MTMTTMTTMTVTDEHAQAIATLLAALAAVEELGAYGDVTLRIAPAELEAMLPGGAWRTYVHIGSSEYALDTYRVSVGAASVQACTHRAPTAAEQDLVAREPVRFSCHRATVVEQTP